MGIFQKLSGILGSTFQIGGTSGPLIKNTSGAVGARNAADSAFVPVNAGTPTAWGNNAVVTATMLQQAFIVGTEFNGGTATLNTGTVRYLLCTTTGGGYTAGDLAFDNGTSNGNVMQIAATSGMIISVTANLNTGTLVIGPGTYSWDGSSYDPLITGYSGIAKSILVNFATLDFAGGTKSSTATIPANATILNTRVQVLTGGTFSAGTVSVGHSATAALLQATTDNVLTTEGLYIVEGTTTNADWGNSALPVQLTFTGAPSSGGTGRAIVTYTTPDT